MARNRSSNPFEVDMVGVVCQVSDSTDRIRMVKQFTATQCHAALKLPNLQKTVKQAVERRLRQLEKLEGGARNGSDRTTSGWIGQP